VDRKKVSSVDGFVKSPSAALRFTVKGLNVQKVRLAFSRLARLAYEAFYEAVDNVYLRLVTLPFIKNKEKFRLFTKLLSIKQEKINEGIFRISFRMESW